MGWGDREERRSRQMGGRVGMAFGVAVAHMVVVVLVRSLLVED
jgi:hypothetical protein